MAGAPDIYDDILETLKKNGDIDVKHYRRLVLYTLVDLGRERKDIAEMSKKISNLERNCIVLIAKKHPKVTTTILGIFSLFVIAVIIRMDLWIWIADKIGLPLP